MKIVIVGAGISGLTTYLFLKKLSSELNPPIEITLYERHYSARNCVDPDSKASASASTTVGGALGIAPNGLHVLRHLDEDLFLQVGSLGCSISQFSMRNCHGHTLSRFPATDSGDPPMQTVLISRQLFWETLRSKVPDGDVVHAVVARVECCSNAPPRVVFANGSPDVEADLIIGADGIRSIVKKSVTGDGQKDDYPAVFEGLVGVGGFIPASRLSPNHSPDQLTLTFGADGFFGYGPCTPSQLNHKANHIPDTSASQAVWWSTYQIPTLPEKDNPDFEDIKGQLQQRHSHWNNSVIRDIVSNVQIDSIYPTWTTPDLPTWESNGVVLIGDAAHALQTSSGQGASQALEDAQVLSMLLTHHLLHRSDSKENAIRLATKQYVDVRKPRVKRIADRAKQMGDMKRKKGLLEEWITYFFIWLMGLLGDWDGYGKFLSEDLPIHEVRKVLEC